ncbi:MAG: enoyl-CoA hydratase-related protein [Suipraeoptans sp.]
MGLIKYEVEEHIGVITINRPEAMNALNSQVIKEIKDTLHSVDASEIRCLIFTGAGNKAFAAGADIAEMCEYSREQGEAFSKNGNNTFLKLEKMPMPVIAAVNGYALGGGLELTLCCDIRICSENAKFGQPETGLGITPGFGGTQRLARVVNIGMAKELIYSCRMIDASEAVDLGIVNHVYKSEDLMSEAMKLAGKIASNAPIAVRNSKKAINKGGELEIESAVEVEEQLFGKCFETKDQIRAMKGFLEKNRNIKFTNE